MKIRPEEAELFHADRRTDMTRLAVAFRNFENAPKNIWDRDISVGIATRHGLEVPAIESLRGRDFPHPSRPALRPTQPPTQWAPDIFSRG
jgi:hypothetical protein